MVKFISRGAIVRGLWYCLQGSYDLFFPIYVLLSRVQFQSLDIFNIGKSIALLKYISFQSKQVGSLTLTNTQFKVFMSARLQDRGGTTGDNRCSL